MLICVGSSYDGGEKWFFDFIVQRGMWDVVVM